MRAKRKFQLKNMDTNTKNILLITFLVIVIISLCLTIYFNFMHQNKKDAVIKSSEDILNRMTEEEKKILKIEKTEKEKKKEELKKKVEEKTTTEEFKKFEELTDEEKKEIDVIPRKEEVPIDELDDITDEEDNNIVIPKKYDLRDHINIKVDDQGDYGLCWAFASFNALETHLALKQKKTYDFSEIHMDYIESDYLYGGRPLHEGGNWDNFKDYFSISGPVSEKVAKYGDLPAEVYKKFPDMDSEILVTKAVSFPSIRKGEDATSEEDTKKIRDAIKRHIMKNGGVFAAIYTQGSENQFNTSGFWGNHAITIIGWDDDYSKDNFVDIDENENSIVPKNDGAYIAVNSWGENWGKKGYFYISYEDKIVETDVNGVVSTSLKDAYKISDIKSETIKKYILEKFKFNLIPYNGENYITDFVLSNVVMLDLSNMNLTNADLKDISLFPKINDLNLSGNPITSISNLPELSRLTSINLSNTKVNDLSYLSKYPELYSAQLENCNITNINSLKDIKNLSFINLNNNNISDVSALNNLSAIESVSLDNNSIKDISVLNSKKIFDLSLNGNQGITGYSKLKPSRLSLNNCGIKELEDISSTKSISTLVISNNPNIVIKKGYLPNEIYELNISGNNLNNLEFLEGVNSLAALDASNNNLTDLKDLPGSDEEFPFSINISNNPIKNIDSLDKYKNVSINYSNTNNVDLSLFNGLKNINYIDLSNDSITDLSKLNIEKLDSINLSNNKELKNISALKEIKDLSGLLLDKCCLKDLSEITELTNIKVLSLDSNNIQDVSELNKLNKLVTLSLSDNNNLSGALSLNNLFNLSLGNTNINNLDMIKDLKELSFLDLNNTKVNDIYKIYDYFSDENKWMFVRLSDDETEFSIDSEEMNKFPDNPRIELDGIDYIDVNLKGSDFNEYINNKWALKKQLMRTVDRINQSIEMENGTIDKKISKITYIDNNKPFILKPIYQWTTGIKIYK